MLIQYGDVSRHIVLLKALALQHSKCRKTDASKFKHAQKSHTHRQSRAIFKLMHTCDM